MNRLAIPVNPPHETRHQTRQLNTVPKPDQRGSWPDREWRAIVETLKGTRVAHYYGIALSSAALELARKALESLGCPVTLDHRDFVEALRDWPESVDVAWIGLSLHHLLAPGHRRR